MSLVGGQAPEAALEELWPSAAVTAMTELLQLEAELMLQVLVRGLKGIWTKGLLELWSARVAEHCRT